MPGASRDRSRPGRELVFALSLAMLAYTGVETVADIAEDARDPSRQVPKAVDLVRARGARRVRRRLNVAL